MMNRSRALLRRWLLWAAPSALALAAASCTDRAADLELRLSQTQNELERTKAELETASRKESPAEPAALPSVSEIERNYDHALKEFRQELDQQISDGRITSFTPTHPIIEEKPYTAGVRLEAMLHGRTVALEPVPMRAGLDGKWSFPSAGEVLDLLNKAPAGPATPAPETPSTAARTPPAEPPHQLVSPMPASETIKIEWPKPPGSAAPPAPARGPRDHAPR